MNAGTRPMSVASVERIFVSHGLSHLRVQLCEFVQNSEIRLALGVVAHPDEMEQDHFQGRISRSFSFAEAGPVYHRTSVADGGNGIRDDKAGVIVGVELQIAGREAIGPKGIEQLWYSSGKRHVFIGQRHTESIADPEFRTQGTGIPIRLCQNSFDKTSNKIDGCAGGVLEM